MEAPTIFSDTKILNLEKCDLLFEGNKCLLTIARSLQKLKFNLKVDENTNVFEGNFSYEEFIKLNNIFGLFYNLEEIEKSIKQSISDKNIELTRGKGEQMNLYFKVIVLAKTIEVNIPLNKREKNQNEIVKLLLEENKDLKKEINSLKEENKDLKKEINDLKEESNNIKLTLNLLQNKFKEFESSLFNNNFENDKNYFDVSNISITKVQSDLIINRLKQVDQFKNKKNFEINLLFRGTRDGDDSLTFHKLCDNKRNILVLLETTKNRKFGGFCSIGYKSAGGNQKDNSAFIYSLDKMKIYNVINNETAVYWGSNYGAMFGGAKCVVENKFFSRDCYANDKNEYYQIPESYDYNGGEWTYRIKEIEVYQIN